MKREFTIKINQSEYDLAEGTLNTCIEWLRTYKLSKNFNKKINEGLILEPTDLSCERYTIKLIKFNIINNNEKQ